MFTSKMNRGCRAETILRLATKAVALDEPGRWLQKYQQSGVERNELVLLLGAVANTARLQIRLVMDRGSTDPSAIERHLAMRHFAALIG